MKLQTLVGALALFLLGGCASSAQKALEQQLTTCKNDLAGCQSKLASYEKGMGDEKSARELAERRLQAFRELAAKLRAAFGAGNMKIVIRNGRLVIQLPNKILYDFGKAELKREGEEALGKLAPVLKQTDRDYLIAGHTDNVPVSKKNKAYKSNWELSTLRSLAVVTVLERLGVSPKQLGAAGYGEYDPETSNDSEEGRTANRRTEIIIMPKIDEIPRMPDSI